MDAEVSPRVRAVAELIHDRFGQAGGSRPKPTTDAAWCALHGTDTVDLATTDFRSLPRDWRDENLAAAASVCSRVDGARAASLDPTEPAVLEALAAGVHEDWLVRNRWFAPPEQSVPYRRLSEADKERDRALVRAALADLSAS